MNTKVQLNPENVKFSTIRDLGQFPGDFARAAEPLTKMLDNRLNRLENASDKSLPYLLEEIQMLSDGLSNLEALFGTLCEMYNDLGEACLRLEERRDYFSHQYEVMKVKEWKRNLIANRKNRNNERTH